MFLRSIKHLKQRILNKNEVSLVAGEKVCFRLTKNGHKHFGFINEQFYDLCGITHIRLNCEDGKVRTYSVSHLKRLNSAAKKQNL